MGLFDYRLYLWELNSIACLRKLKQAFSLPKIQKASSFELDFLFFV